MRPDKDVLPKSTGHSSPPIAVALSTAFSQTMEVDPTSTLEASEFKTAPYMIRASGPTETPPTSTAVGATNADAYRTGSVPRLLISISPSQARDIPIVRNLADEPLSA